MDRESVERLRFDSRLKTRAGWVDSATEDAYLEALPDVSEKLTTCGEEDDAAEAAAEAAFAASPPPTPELQPAAPTPLAGDFSTPTSFSTSATPPPPPTAPSSTSPSVPPISPTSPISPATPPPASPEPSAPRDQGSAGTFPGETSGGAGSFGRNLPGSDTQQAPDTQQALGTQPGPDADSSRDTESD